MIKPSLGGRLVVGSSEMTSELFWQDIGIPLANTSYWNEFIDQMNLVRYTKEGSIIKLTNTSLNPPQYRGLVIRFFKEEWLFINETIELLNQLIKEGDCKNEGGEYNFGYSKNGIFCYSPGSNQFVRYPVVFAFGSERMGS